MVFPPSFFDSMEHLPIHLAYEAKLGGPVQYRWMYPFERCMFYLKKKVRNKACPEGSIAEAYWIEEIVNFCSHYFDSSILTKYNRPDRNDDGAEQDSGGKLPVFVPSGRPFGKGKHRWLRCEELNAIALYVLLNCDYDKAYEKINEHRDLVKDRHPDYSEIRVDQEHYATLVEWFQQNFENDEDIHMKILAEGPHRSVMSYNGFNVNGFRFHSKKLEQSRTTQNSGVLVKGSNYGIDEDYYGKLVEVIEVDYYGGNTVSLFKCEWYDPKKGVEVDKYGFTKVNTKSRLRSYEPFVIASQVTQVFYARSVSKKNDPWSTVISTKARNTYDVKENEESEDENTYQEDEIHDLNLFDIDHEGDNLTLHDDTQPGFEVEYNDVNELLDDDDYDFIDNDENDDEGEEEEEEEEDDIFSDDDAENDDDEGEEEDDILSDDDANESTDDDNSDFDDAE